MSDIQFDEGGVNNSSNNSYKSRVVLGSSATPKMVQMILKTGIVKTEKQGGNMLLGIAILCLALAIWISYSFVFGGRIGPVKLTPEQKQRQEQIQQRIQQRNNARSATSSAQ